MDYSALLDSVRPVFVAECNEHINTLELGLITLEETPDDIELLNSIFRAVHSLKGSCGMYGLDHIVEFTHDFESVMDRVRNFEVKVTEELSDLLVSCFDHLKELISGIENNDDEFDKLVQKQLMEKLQAWLTVDEKSKESSQQEQNTYQNSAEVNSVSVCLCLNFEPESFMCGCKPNIILREIEELSIIKEIKSHLHIPTWEDYNPEHCYLSLQIVFTNISDKQALESIFEFTDVIRWSWIDIDKDSDFVNKDSNNDTEKQNRAKNDIPNEVETKKNIQTKNLPKIEKSNTETKRFIRVEADKLDRLIGLVGELIVDFGGLQALSEKVSNQHASLHQRVSSASKILDDLRESSLNLRLMPIADTFNRFHRVVRDTAKQLDKDVKLTLEGTETELDKTILEKIADPLTHLVRNSVDHGLEQPKEREALGKGPKGLLTLKASHLEGRVRIEIIDDGRGIDPDIIRSKAKEKGLISDSDDLDDKAILQLIFEPGFSTAKEVTDISGRGVGMDVVRRNIQDIGGEIILESDKGQGTQVDIRLPLTMAILPGFRVKICKQDFIVPLTQLDECINAHQLFNDKSDDNHTLWLRGEILPVLDMRPLLYGCDSKNQPQTEAIIVQTVRGRMVLCVDELVGEIQTVVKPLDPIVAKVPYYSGMTQLGTGEIVPILDINGTVDVSRQTNDLIKTGS